MIWTTSPLRKPWRRPGGGSSSWSVCVLTGCFAAPLVCVCVCMCEGGGGRERGVRERERERQRERAKFDMTGYCMVCHTYTHAYIHTHTYTHTKCIHTNKPRAHVPLNPPQHTQAYMHTDRPYVQSHPRSLSLSLPPFLPPSLPPSLPSSVPPSLLPSLPLSFRLHTWQLCYTTYRAGWKPGKGPSASYGTYTPPPPGTFRT